MSQHKQTLTGEKRAAMDAGFVKSSKRLRVNDRVRRDRAISAGDYDLARKIEEEAIPFAGRESHLSIGDNGSDIINTSIVCSESSEEAHSSERDMESTHLPNIPGVTYRGEVDNDQDDQDDHLYHEKFDLPLVKHEFQHDGRVQNLITSKYVDAKTKNGLRYMKRFKVAPNTYKVEYNHGKDALEIASGRLVPNHFSLQQMPARETQHRQYLSCGQYDDVDLVNCQPTIANQFLLQRNLIVPQMQYYVENRQDCLKKWNMEKHDVIAVLNTVNAVNWHPDLKAIHRAIYEKLVPILKGENPDIWQKVLKSRKPKTVNNREGSFFSQVCQTTENTMLLLMHHYFLNAKFRPDVLISDGCQIRKDPENPLTPDHLRACEQYIFDKTQMQTRIAIKPMEVPASYYERFGLIADNDHHQLFPILDENTVFADSTEEKEPLFLEPLYPENPRLDELAKSMICEKSHAACAQFISELWRNDFFYGDNSWWHFENHYWKDSPYSMTHKIMFELFPILDELTSWRDTGGDLDGHISNLKRSLSDLPTSKNIASACIGHFQKLDYHAFKCSLNRDLALLCFKNGVYDLNAGHLRDGKPQDRISIQINYDFVDFSLPENVHIFKRLGTILQQILPDRDEREYVLDILACALGGKRTNKLEILLGEGANGKSLLTQLMELALGPYATSWSTAMLCTEFDPTAPNTELNRARHVRFINIQEGKKSSQFNMETFRKYTGGDSFNGIRDLFEKGSGVTSFVLHAQLWLSLNTLMAISEANHATWRRLELLEMRSKFVEDESEVDVKNNRYLADECLKNELHSLAPAFMWLLVEKRYRDMRDKNDFVLSPPTSVIEATERYRSEQNVYQLFFDDMCTFDSEGRIFNTELFEKCQQWAKINLKAVTKADMKKWLLNQPGVQWKDSLKIMKSVGDFGQRSVEKVSRGYLGIKLNKYE
ncbi:uncharacterized protein EV422DRAFT_503638 [Fimicolochytrium jonesii]|uniref:uncharacterized protein n=1 Tax=Fimicolochytrium jonesii TaxID=1396493 RepID=UPI0022FF38F8|nr:uncharacterized protein EV422DRAFT_503638 [Fimicolochytrium jonesii]KAI8824836.1 hypothetical protein EV422DRAFT_503638 [Fimicolochytrium jonesii]